MPKRHKKRAADPQFKGAFRSYWFPKPTPRATYSLKDIMSKAQSLIKNGSSRASAFKAAWKAAREGKVITVKPNGYRVLDPRCYDRLPTPKEAWRHAVKGKGELLALWHPKPRDAGEKAIIEATIHVPMRVYRSLRASGEFDVLSDGVLARRGRKKKATNIFIIGRR